MIGSMPLAGTARRRTEMAAVVQEHQHRIFRYCVLRLGSVYGQEVAQDVFLAAWQQLEEFRGEAEILRWLLGIAKNKCAQMLRNARRREEITRMFGEEIMRSLHPDSEVEKEEQNQLQVQLARLRQGMDQLTGEERMLVHLRYSRGLKIDEIAELTGKSAEAMRKRLLRILKRLRRIVADVAEER